MTKINWQVASPPTGRYRSFFRRGWPTGSINHYPIAHIKCEDEYIPSKVANASHKPLKVQVAIKSSEAEREKKGAFTWKTLKAEFKTLKAAKEAAEKFYNEHPELFIVSGVPF